MAMTRDQVREMLDRVLTWPPEAQDEAVASLATIEEQFAALQTLSPEDRDALARSAEDMKLGRYATEEQVKAFLTVTDVHDVRLTGAMSCARR
jgi:uncharacterized protein YbaP (TraB family)